MLLQRKKAQSSRALRSRKRSNCNLG